MKSNYKRLGDYIEIVNIKNSGNKVKLLLGVSIEKKFIKSIANTIGTDMKNYQIVKKWQFAYGPVTSRNGNKISVALLTDNDECIISSAYTAFKVIDENELLPEYLMLWFRRPEFDRYARFHSHGSAREIFDWEEMCNVMLPIPDITKQQEIVNAYNTIENRIALKQQINANLEEQIQSNFTKMFECCICNKGHVLGEYATIVLGGTPSREEKSYWGGNIPWIQSGKVNDFRIVSASEYITSDGLNFSSTKLMPKYTVVLAITGATLGQESILLIDSCANQSVIGILENEFLPYQFIHPFIKESLNELLRNQTGGAQPHINKNDIKDIPIKLPNKEDLEKYIKIVNPMYRTIENNCFEIQTLDKLKAVLIN